MSSLPRSAAHASSSSYRWAQWLAGAQGAAGRATFTDYEWRTSAIAAGDVQREWGSCHPMKPQYYVHPSAYVDEPCTIGAGTKIWHFCHVMSGAHIGERCILGQNVHVAPDVVIGNNVKIQNNVSVYTGVELEDDVFCGPSCVFTNVINPRSQIVRHSQYLRTLVRRGASLGANSTIVCGATIGRYAFIGAGAVV